MITRIEITFPEPVESTPTAERLLDEAAGLICKRYEEKHPDRVMWPAGIGSKMLTNLLAGDDLKFDDSVFHIECAERERYDTERKRPRFSYRVGYPLTWGNILRMAWQRLRHPKWAKQRRFELFRDAYE